MDTGDWIAVGACFIAAVSAWWSWVSARAAKETAATESKRFAIANEPGRPEFDATFAWDGGEAVVSVRNVGSLDANDVHAHVVVKLGADDDVIGEQELGTLLRQGESALVRVGKWGSILATSNARYFTDLDRHREQAAKAEQHGDPELITVNPTPTEATAVLTLSWTTPAGKHDQSVEQATWGPQYGAA